MAQYTVQHRYSAYRDGIRFGPWDKGDTIDLSEADADWINRDSEGCVAPVKLAAAKTADPSPDRQHKGGRSRSGS